MSEGPTKTDYTPKVHAEASTAMADDADAAAPTMATVNARGSRDAESYCPTCDASYPQEFETCPRDKTRLVHLGRAADPLIGRTIRGNFTLRRRIGEGGMGAVYVAWQQSVGREVAVKVISDRVCRNWSAAKRFLREAKLASRLSHPHIVTIHDFGQAKDELLYIVMEYLDAGTLRDVVKAEGPMSAERVVRIGEQLCSALEFAHEQEIIHRDLKPANVILTEHSTGGDFVKVLDFGIAKSMSDDSLTTLTHSGQILGTPAYMAPEASLDGVASVRTDLYSLGVVLYYMLAGNAPFTANDIRLMISMHASEQPAQLPASVPAGLERLVTKLLSKDPAKRYASAAEVRAALLAVDTSQVAGTERAVYAEPGQENATAELTPGRGRAVVPVILLAAAVVAVVALLVMAPWSRNPGRTQARAAPVARPAPDAGHPAKTTAPAASKLGAATSTVTFIVESTPAADIYVDGAHRGRTRQTLAIPRRDARVVIELRRDGYKTWRESYSPTRDVHISKQLGKRPTRKRPRRPAVRKPKRNDDRGFVPP